MTAEQRLKESRRELDALRHDVAVACQSSGTMLTDLQPEAMIVVQRVCELHPLLSAEVEQLRMALYVLHKEGVISAGKVRELSGMSVEQLRQAWRDMNTENHTALRAQIAQLQER